LDLVPPLVSLFPTWMLSKMLIGDLSSTSDDDDYNMHNNLLSSSTTIIRSMLH
jgi:hypothetical protein